VKIIFRTPIKRSLTFTGSGLTMADLAPKLNISQPAVSMSTQRGERIASENGYSLMDE